LRLVPCVLLAFLLSIGKVLATCSIDGFPGCLCGLFDLLTIAGKAVLVGVISACRRAVAFAFVLLPGILLLRILLPGILFSRRFVAVLLWILLIAHDALLPCGWRELSGGHDGRRSQAIYPRKAHTADRVPRGGAIGSWSGDTIK